MLRGFILFFFLCESTVKSLRGFSNVTYIPASIMTTEAPSSREKPSLQLVATPEHPVAEGQTVSLHCSARTTSTFDAWCWQRFQNQTWKQVANGRDLILTKLAESGNYRCCAQSQLSQKYVSHTHTVIIIPMQATVGEKLGIAAFVLSLLVLIILATLLWLGCQRLGDTPTTSNTAVKGFPGPNMASKGGFPQTDGDGDVYMNYTSTDKAYSDLNPSSVTGDNVYSSLS